MTYEELSNLKLEDVNEKNIKSIKKVAHFKRNRFIEAGVVGTLCFLITSIPMFFFGFVLPNLITSICSFLLGGAINVITNNTVDFCFINRCGLVKYDYTRLKKSGKLAEIRQIVKQYKILPTKNINKIKELNNIEDKPKIINDKFEISNRLIGRAVSKNKSKKYGKYVPTDYENDDTNRLGLN